METNQPQPTANPHEQWKAAFLQQVANNHQMRYDLFDIIEGVRQLEEYPDPTQGICLLLSEFLKQQRADFGQHKYDLAAVAQVIGLINRLIASFYCFNANADYVDQYEEALAKGKEVGHEQ